MHNHHKQSILNDAWAASAQIFTAPKASLSQWSVSEELIEEMGNILMDEGNDVDLQLKMELERAGPAVGMK